MSQQIIDVILRNEEEAQEILRRAAVSVREIIQKSREKCEIEQKARVESAKTEALAFLDAAEKQAETERLERLKQNDAECGELEKKAWGKTEEAVQFITGRLVNGDR